MKEGITIALIYLHNGHTRIVRKWDRMSRKRNVNGDNTRGFLVFTRGTRFEPAATEVTTIITLGALLLCTT
jgi:hypothetical protein